MGMNDRLRAAGRQHQIVMVPAEQDRLEQDSEASKDRDPAPRSAMGLLVHGFSVIGAPVSISRCLGRNPIWSISITQASCASYLQIGSRSHRGAGRQPQQMSGTAGLHHLSRPGASAPTTEKGHEDPILPPELSASYVIRRETFAGTHGDGRDAPRAAVHTPLAIPAASRAAARPSAPARTPANDSPPASGAPNRPAGICRAPHAACRCSA
jgi:hypothetical protein